MTGVQLHIETTGRIPHEPGRRRVLAAGRTRGGSALIQTKALWGDIAATGRRPDAAADDALAAELAVALAERRAAEPAARAGRAAWQQRDEAAT